MYKIDLYFKDINGQKTIHKVNELKEALELFSKEVIECEIDYDVMLIKNNKVLLKYLGVNALNK